MTNKKLSLKDRALAAVSTRPAVGAAAVATAPPASPKTGPGALMAHLAKESTVQRENDQLRTELETWEGATPARKLDPTLVKPSRWANRHPDSFRTAEFNAFKEEIRVAGGNIQPAKVRPSPGTDGEFELVFGHRRHRACLELGLPLLAVIESIDDQSLFAEMDRENRNRQDLSPWEQGKMYLNALDSGLFPSARKLAEHVDAHHSVVSKALSLARLPQPVIDAFASPLDVQFRWAKPLTDLNEADQKTLLKRAVLAQALGPDRTSKTVMDMLLGVDEPTTSAVPQEPISISVRGKSAAVIRFDAKGKATVSFSAEAVPPTQVKALKRAIEAFLILGRPEKQEAE